MGKFSAINISAAFGVSVLAISAAAAFKETHHEIEGDVLGVSGCSVNSTYAENPDGSQEVLSSAFACEADKGDDIWIWDQSRGDVVSLKLNDAVVTDKLPVPGMMVRAEYTSTMAKDFIETITKKPPSPFVPPVQYAVDYEDLTF